MTEAEDVLRDEIARNVVRRLVGAGVQLSTHENTLQWRMVYEAKAREMQIMFYGYDRLVEDYYCGHGKHPDDQRLPINLWDSTP